MATNDSKLELDKLHSYDEFPIWEYGAHRLLSQLDLLRFIKTTNPDVPPAAGSDGYPEFNTKQQRALGIMFKSLDKNTQSLVLDEDTLIGFWRVIKNRFGARTAGDPVIRTMADTIKNADPNNVVQAIAHLNVGFASLSKHAVDLDEKIKIGILYAVMPDYMNSAISILDETGNESYSRACNKFVHEYENRKAPSNQANLTCFGCGDTGHMQKNCTKMKKNTGSKEFCRYCKKHGHSIDDCRKLKAKKKQQERDNKNNNRRNPRYQANVIGTTDSDPFVLLTYLENEEDLDNLPESINVHYDSNSDSEDIAWDFNTEVSDPLAFAMSDGSNCTEGPFIDSACSVHMWNNKDAFVEYEPLQNRFVRVGDDFKLKAEGKGRVKVSNIASQVNPTIIFTDVLHVPALSKSLISVSALDDKGCTLTFGGGKCKASAPNDTNILFSGTKLGESRLYQLDFADEQSNLVDYRHQNDLELYHHRMGHCSDAVLNKLPSVSTGITQLTASDRPFCSDCPLGRMQRLPKAGSSNNKASRPLELIHCDIKGPVSPLTPSGNKYLIIYLDDFSGFIYPFLLKDRTDQRENFHTFKLHVEKLFGATVENLLFFRTDGAREFADSELLTYLANNGIQHQIRAADQPQQLGRPERAFRTIFNMVRSMLSHAAVNRNLWGEAALTSCFLLNRLPTSSNPDYITPYEMIFSRPPELSKIRTWGSDCYAFVADSPALHDRAIKCKLLGFVGEEVHAYRLLNCSTNRVVVRYNVIFDESSIFSSSSNSDSNPSFDFSLSSPPAAPSPPDIIQSSSGTPDAAIPSPDVGSDISLPIAARKTPRNVKGVDKLEYHTLGGNIVHADIDDVLQVVGSCYNVYSDSVEPNTYDEAVNGPDSEKWVAAMGEEHQALLDNGTWSYVAAPEDVSLLKCKWVYKIKRNESGDIMKYKARLVAKGFTQEHGVNYFETFSPVAKIQTIRLIFFLAVQLTCFIVQFDIPNAYIKAPVHEDIYMEQPQGFTTGNSVLKLIKALYGTKQAGRCWNMEFSDFLLSLGFKQCSFDPCLFHLVDSNDFLLLVLYVDDVLAVSNSQQLIDRILHQIEVQFSITLLGFPRWFLGIKITKDDTNSVFLDQSKAVMDILKRFRMESASVVQFPFPSKSQLMPLQDDDQTNMPYRSLVGSLMYLMTSTRPDLAVATSLLGQFMANPGPSHWNAAKRVIRYLKGTPDLSLAIQPCSNLDPSNMVTAYSDSDWGKDPSDRKSYSGYVVFVGNSLVSWKCKKQSAVALSTAEAEYMALTLAATEVIWIRNLLSEIGFTQQQPSKVFCDNQSAIHMAINDVIGPKSKHIAIKFHFIKQAIANNDIILEYIPSAQNIADFMTKPLDNQKFFGFRDSLNLQRTPGF